MADDQFNKTVLLSFETKLGNAKQEILDLNDSLGEQLKNQRLLELQGKRNTDAYVEVSSAVRNTKQAIRDANREYDNAVKAINSANNSIKQNRALVSTLTAEYIKLEQTEGKLSPRTIQLKDQINQLTKTLKDQEKAIGQTNRNVGNYEDSIKSALSTLTGAMPGFQQLGAAGQVVTRVIGFMPSALIKAGTAITNFTGNAGRAVIGGFLPLKQSAAEATEEVKKTEEALVSTEKSSTETSGALSTLAADFAGFTTAVFVAAIGSATYYLSQFRGTSQEVSKFFGGVKNQFANFGKNIVDALKGENGASLTDLVNPAHLFKNFVNSFNEGMDVTAAMQDVQNMNQVNDQQIAKMQAQADQYRALSKNVKLSAQERVGWLKNAQAEENRILDQQTQNAKDNIDAGIELAQKNGKKLTAMEIDTLKQGDEYAMQRANQWAQSNKITEAGYEALTQAYDRKTAALQAASMKLIKQQNDEAKIEHKANREQIDEVANAEKAIKQAEDAKAQSIARTAEFTMDQYGKELAAADAHYKELIFKQKQFVADQDKHARLAHSPEAKKKFEQAKAEGLKVIDQIGNEWQAALSKIIADNTEKMDVVVSKAFDNLQRSYVENIQNTEQREIAGLQLQEQIRLEAYHIETAERQNHIDELQLQATTANENERRALQKQIHDLQAIQEAANTESELAAAKSQRDIIQAKVNAARQLQNSIDLANVLNNAPKPGETDSKEEHNYKRAQIEHKYDQEIADAKKAGLDVQGLEAEKNHALLELDDQYYQQKFDKAKQWETLIQNTAFDIAKNAINSQLEYTLAAMERQKTFDLNNQSLTATQRAEIEEKYRVKEGRAKQKAFKSDQELSISKAFINGALAITKTTAELGWPAALLGDAFIVAETATEIAAIAAQKPPAYATGGVHAGNGPVKGPGSGTSDSVNARLSNGESVINAKSTSMFWPLLSAINQAGGGVSFDKNQSRSRSVSRFATGGVMSTYLPTTDSGLRPNINGSNFAIGTGRMHPDDLSALSGIMTDAIRNIPAPLVDVKDINRQQGLLSNVSDRNRY